MFVFCSSMHIFLKKQTYKTSVKVQIKNPRYLLSFKIICLSYTRHFFSTHRQIRQASLAFGPQHPAAHGILKLQLYLTGDTIRWLDPQFGLLHRGTEKLFENRNLLQALPYFDRFDYVANLFQEHAFCLAVESLHSNKTFLTAPILMARRVFDELSRILNHLLTLSATALDLSAMGPIFWAFEERENVLELCEQASGARMHTALYRPFFFDFSIFTGSFLNELAQFLTRCARSLSGAFLGLLNNRSLKSRLAGVGQVSKLKIQNYGLSGILARSAGLYLDQRSFNLQTANYSAVTYRTFLGKRGDNLDRFLIRVKETAESFRILSQSLQTFRFSTRNMNAGYVARSALNLMIVLKPTSDVNFMCRFARYLRFFYNIFFFKYVSAYFVKNVHGTSVRNSKATKLTLANTMGAVIQPNRGKFSSMESLISHFRLTSEG
jgi:NADH-quinone oxidoreductase subunit D